MAKKIKKDEESVSIVDLGTEMEKAKEYIDKFFTSKNFNNERMDAYAELMAFYQGNQHLLKKYKTIKPWVINMNTPYATVAIDNRVSSLLANDYIGELLPLDKEDVDSIDALSRLYKKEWQRMNIDQCVRECISGSAVVREYYIHILLNGKTVTGKEGKKKVGSLEAYAIEPSAIFIDPTARKLRNARYMFVAGRISKEEAIEKYPKIEALKNSSSSFSPQDRGEVYYDNDYTSQQEDVFTTLTYYGKQKSGKLKRVFLVNSIIVEEKDMELKNFPISQLRFRKAAQSCYGLGLMDEVLSLQKAICSIESAITNTALAYAAPSMIVRKGCGIDPTVVAKAAGAPGVVYSVDGDTTNAIVPVIPPKIDDNILKIKTDFENKIDKILGNTQQFLGDIGTAGNTAGGSKIAVDRAKIIELGVLNNISEFVEDISATLVEYIISLYGGENISVYDGKDDEGNHKFEEIKMPETSKLSDAGYKYYIELNTKTPYSKEYQKELLKELFVFERQYDAPIKSITVSDVIKNSDLTNKDEIVSRFNKLTFQDAQTKASVINQFISAAGRMGVPNELLLQGIAEIVASDKETPAVDKILQTMEQQFQQEMQAKQQQQSSAIDNVVNQLPNGGEQPQMMQQSPVQTQM